MESYPRKEETLIVISVEQQYITVRGPDRFVYQARCIPTHVRRQAKPLKPKDFLFVTHANFDISAVVERVTKRGSLDGCKYKLDQYRPVSEQN